MLLTFLVMSGDLSMARLCLTFWVLTFQVLGTLSCQGNSAVCNIGTASSDLCQSIPQGQSDESVVHCLFVFCFCLLFTSLSHWAIDCPVDRLCASKVSCGEKQGCAQVWGTCIPHQQEAAALHSQQRGMATVLLLITVRDWLSCSCAYTQMFDLN